MSPKKKQTGPNAYQVKLTVQDIDPSIWRRLLISGEDTLADLHDAIQICFGWDNCHLHEFNIGKKRYGTQDEDCPPDVLDDEAYSLDQILKGKKAKFEYVYDFGDNWRVDVVVEDVQPLDPDQLYPHCVDGSRRGPAEDSGGPWGYMSKLETLRNPDDPDYADIVDWMGEDWDPEHFDLQEINAALQSAPEESAIDFENLSEEERDEMLEAMLDQDPFLEERVARMHDRIATVHSLKTPEAVHDFIEAMEPEELREFAMKHMANNPKDAAFEYALLALEADDPAEALQLATSALELDPENVDARLALSNVALSEGDVDRAMAHLREGHAIAASALGDKLADYSLDFGDIVETRPYMRAIYSLANALVASDETEEAVGYFREMLDREPNDSMGARYSLAGAYLELRQIPEARAVIREYNTDGDPILPWAHVLERFLAGKKKEAEAGLEEAIAANPLMATSLLDPESIPDLDESDLGLTTKMTLASFGKAWLENEKAIEWLASKVYGR
ncbi:MAG: tetratricopeptide repeat protein [Candidatus Hydrogenedentes bacterium]|nr:tetratricopeptide repeat protein [Candidatus Hydrogenedentota bacterium]